MKKYFKKTIVHLEAYVIEHLRRQLASTSWADYSEDDFILSIHELSAHSSGCQILGFIYFGLYL